MNKKEVLKAINDQINFELESAYIYKKMAIELESQGWKGSASWLQKQYIEELEHADKMINYVLERGEKPEIREIKMNDIKAETLLDYFELAYNHERLVSEKIDNIVTIATEKKDYATENFFRTFVDEQVEEEATTSEIVDRLKLASGNAGYMIIDMELGKR